MKRACHAAAGDMGSSGAVQSTNSFLLTSRRRQMSPSRSSLAIATVIVLLSLFSFLSTVDAFTSPSAMISKRPPSAAAGLFVARKRGNNKFGRISTNGQAPLGMSSEEDPAAVAGVVAKENSQNSDSDDMDDLMAEAEMDAETRLAMEKSRRAAELRAQEVFMKKKTGRHVCTNCAWEYDETKGDVMMIGGQIQPGTAFADLPADWRCPVCRASKDSFEEVVEEIPGFEVNQGYGFGTNSWTAGQKNLAIFGGLGFFFLLFLSGYALS